LKKTILNKSLIILDRDGCINIPQPNHRYIHKVEDFKIYPDVVDFCKNSILHGIRLAIATNQQGISKNLYRLEDVKLLHQLLLQKLSVDETYFPIYVCPHLSNDRSCDCRKPKPGLLLKAMEHFEVPPKSALFIGDSLSDKVAAGNAGLDFCHLDRLNKLEFRSDYQMNNLSWEYLEEHFK